MQVSRKRLSQETWDSVWRSLVLAIKGNLKETDLELLFKMVLGVEERTMMAKRLMIGVLVISEWDVVSIAEVLKLTRATVHKYKALALVNNDYKDLLKRTFPNKIRKISRSKQIEAGSLEDLIDKIMLGKRDRSRMYQ